MRQARSASIIVVVMLAPVLAAQSTPSQENLAFDVVSIKRNTSGTRGGSVGGVGDRWRMVNVTIAGVILNAYPSRVSELIGAPEWVTSERYDVEARATFTPTLEQQQAMLRAVLAERFKLVAHVESPERPIYNMVFARADRRLGPQLRGIDVDCTTFDRQKPRPDTPAVVAFDMPPCAFKMSASGSVMVVLSGGRTLQSLADTVAGQAGRPVFDRTGLTGHFAFKLEYDGTDGASVFTAMQEQLGLKLEPARGPVEILAVDHIERPTEN